MLGGTLHLREVAHLGACRLPIEAPRDRYAFEGFCVCPADAHLDQPRAGLVVEERHVDPLRPPRPAASEVGRAHLDDFYFHGLVFIRKIFGRLTTGYSERASRAADPGMLGEVRRSARIMSSRSPSLRCVK